MSRSARIALGIGIIGVLLFIYLGVAAITASADGIIRVNLLFGYRTPEEIMGLINIVFVGNLIIWGIWIYYFAEGSE